MADYNLPHSDMPSRARGNNLEVPRSRESNLGVSRETLEQILEWAVLVEDEFHVVARRRTHSPIIVLDDDYHNSRADMIQNRQNVGLVCRLWHQIIQQELWKSFTIGCRTDLVKFSKLLSTNSYIRTKIHHLDCFMQQRSPLLLITDQVTSSTDLKKVGRKLVREDKQQHYLYKRIFSACPQMLTFHHISGNLWPFPRTLPCTLIRLCISIHNLPWKFVYRALYFTPKLQILGLYDAPHWVNNDFKKFDHSKLRLKKLHTLEVSFSCEGHTDDETSESFTVAFEKWISCPKLDAVRVKYWDRNSFEDWQHRSKIQRYVSHKDLERMQGIGHDIFSLSISTLDVDFPIHKEYYTRYYTIHRTPSLNHLEFSFGCFHMLRRMHTFVTVENVKFIVINDLGRILEQARAFEDPLSEFNEYLRCLRKILESFYDVKSFPSLEQVVLSGIPSRAKFSAEKFHLDVINLVLKGTSDLEKRKVTTLFRLERKGRLLSFAEFLDIDD